MRANWRGRIQRWRCALVGLGDVWEDGSPKGAEAAGGSVTPRLSSPPPVAAASAG